MRLYFLLAAGVVVAKTLPIVLTAVTRAASDVSSHFDAVYGEAARRAGRAGEAFADRRAERQHARATAAQQQER